jgi:hypothetical protein
LRSAARWCFRYASQWPLARTAWSFSIASTLDPNAPGGDAALKKFVNESHHIESEYVMQLKPCDFDAVPEHVVRVCAGPPVENNSKFFRLDTEAGSFGLGPVVLSHLGRCSFSAVLFNVRVMGYRSVNHVLGGVVRVGVVGAGPLRLAHCRHWPSKRPSCCVVERILFGSRGQFRGRPATTDQPAVEGHVYLWCRGP